VSTAGKTNRIDAMFEAKRAAGERALIFYVTAGFPDAKTTEDVILALDEAGADLIELGIPFSDPVADGPTIQYASQVALDGGMSVREALEIAGRLRKKTDIPLLFFTAYNPIYHFGLERFTDELVKAGGDGLLVPDLPPEEAHELTEICQGKNLKLVFLAAPTTDARRREIITRESTGFVYYISLRGVTGARAELAADLQKKVAELKSATELPVAVGFGISKPEHVRLAGEAADGIVVGSALIDLIAKHAGKASLREEVAAYARSLAEALPRDKAAAGSK
jgi:tryptophan synthase alpha chain